MRFIPALPKWQVKVLLVVLAAVIVGSSVLYIQSIVVDINEKEQSKIGILVDIYRQNTDVNVFSKTDNILELINLVSKTINFPVIITDENDVPLYPFDQWTLNVPIDSTLSMNEQKRILTELVKDMAESYPPLLIKKDDKIISKFYYSQPAYISKMQLFPILELIIIGAFIVIGYMAFSNIRRNQETKVWVGMAKEAAHQLGTPLSSLLAWLEIMKFNKDDPDSVEATALEMENDINRLNMIAVRFSKIGSIPEITLQDLTKNIENVCDYFQKRVPHLGKHIEIERNITENVTAEINSELFAWVIENLLKNALEAIDKKDGRISISMNKTPKKIQIQVSDTGKGMNSKQKRQAFHPGYTTKKRGWGLGLSLCKRIIEQYHNGKIYIKETNVGKGTVFAIELPLKFNS